jgi:hypothetical protein
MVSSGTNDHNAKPIQISMTPTGINTAARNQCHVSP